jgi:tetrahydromethanopterin S-methyltransferase subunit B
MTRRAFEQLGHRCHLDDGHKGQHVALVADVLASLIKELEAYVTRLENERTLRQERIAELEGAVDDLVVVIREKSAMWNMQS